MKARIGHFVEAQILEAIEIDYIDESEVLTMADEENHINKNKFNVPFVCGCRNLGEALRRVAEVYIIQYYHFIFIFSIPQNVKIFSYYL